MLLESRRHTKADVSSWHERARADPIHASTRPFKARVERALEELDAFAKKPGGGYIGVSWGKDSVVVAHMAHRLGLTMPLVWVKMEPIDNPECPLVRDAFLSRWPMTYDEIVCQYDPTTKLTSEPGFLEAARRHGDRHVSGVRGTESATRKRAMQRFGYATERTCRPIGWWSSRDVFAYLHQHDLPVHPAYAMSFGGQLDRDYLRVSSIGGLRGVGHGRRGWEAHYYPDTLRERERLVGPLPM